MYQVLMFDGGVYKINEFYELIEDIGGFVVQKTQIQVQILVTFAIPEEDRPIIEAKARELGGKLLDVPLAGTEIVVVGPTLGRHHMPHPICDIAETLRRYGAITVVMGLARGKGKQTAQINAEEKAIINEYDAAVFVVGNFRECVEKHKYKLWQDIEVPVVATCGPEFSSLPYCEALVCGIGRKVERMRRAEEIQKLEEVASKVQKIITDRRRDIELDPLFVHPAEIKDRLDELEAIQENLRPAPVVLHVDGVRAKVPYDKFKDKIADLEIYGRKLREIATISPSRMEGSILMKIKTRSQVESEDRSRAKD
ncbi:MAG: methanogenesis marker 7 protein [Methanomassiliicoccales archaeon]|nr:MAG: methanogenesis marker 7 protein [Methanomassiliicoccales archaeon]